MFITNFIAATIFSSITECYEINYLFKKHKENIFINTINSNNVNHIDIQNAYNYKNKSIFYDIKYIFKKYINHNIQNSEKVAILSNFEKIHYYYLFLKSISCLLFKSFDEIKNTINDLIILDDDFREKIKNIQNFVQMNENAILSITSFNIFKLTILILLSASIPQQISIYIISFYLLNNLFDLKIKNVIKITELICIIFAFFI